MTTTGWRSARSTTPPVRPWPGAPDRARPTPGRRRPAASAATSARAATTRRSAPTVTRWRTAVPAADRARQRFHDHLPLDEVAEALGIDAARAEREVREATADSWPPQTAGGVTAPGRATVRWTAPTTSGCARCSCPSWPLRVRPTPPGCSPACGRRCGPPRSFSGRGRRRAASSVIAPAAAGVPRRRRVPRHRVPRRWVPASSPRRSVRDPEPIASTSAVRNPSPRAAAVAAGTTPAAPTDGSDRSGTTGGDDLPAPLVAPRGGAAGGPDVSPDGLVAPEVGAPRRRRDGRGAAGDGARRWRRRGPRPGRCPSRLQCHARRLGPGRGGRRPVRLDWWARWTCRRPPPWRRALRPRRGPPRSWHASSWARVART